MRKRTRTAAVNTTALLTILLVIGGIVSSILLLHGHRKRAAVKTALAAGITAYEQGDFREAATLLERYLIADPANIDMRMKFADAQRRIRPRTPDNVRRRISALETVLRVDPANVEAAAQLAELYLLLGAPVEAERVCRNQLEAAPPSTRIRRFLAAALIAQAKYEEAISVLESLVNHDSQDIESATILAFCLLRYRNEAITSARLLDDLVEQNPQSAAALISRSRFRLATGQTDLAMADLKQAEPLARASPKLLIDLGNIWSTLGNRAQANRLFGQAEQAGPSEPDIYIIRTQMALEEGDHEEGVAIARRGLQALSGEGRYDLLSTAAELFATTGDVDEAKRCLAELRGLGALPENLSHIEALVALAEGNTSQGIAVLEGIVGRNPRNVEARLQLSRAYTSTGQLHLAARQLREGMHLSDRFGGMAHIQLARIYASMGRWSQAIRVAAEAQSKMPNDLSVRLTYLELQARVARPGGSQPDPALMKQLHQQTAQLAARHRGHFATTTLLAQLTAWQGDLEQARHILKTSEAGDGEQRLRALVDLLAEAGAYDDAIAEGRAGMDKLSASGQEKLKIRLAEIHATNGDIQRARDMIDGLARTVSDAVRSEAHLNVARMLLQQGLAEPAHAYLAPIVAENPADKPARALLLNARLIEGAGPDGQQLVDQLRAIEGEQSLNWRYWQARVWMDSEGWTQKQQQIQQLLETCLEEDPGWPELLQRLGNFYEKTGQRWQAMRLYQRTLEFDPGNTQVVRYLLRLAGQMGHWTEVERLIQLLPEEDPDVQQYRITHALRQGDIHRASQELTRRIEADAGDFLARLQLAALLHREHQTSEADNLLAEAVEIAPHAPPVLAAQIEACLRQSRFEEALALCDQAWSATADPGVHGLRARVHEAQGDLQQAERNLRLLVDTEGMAEGGYLAIGNMYLRHGQPETTSAVYREGLEALPGSFPLRAALVSVLLEDGDEGQRREGAALLDELLAEQPENTGLLLLKAEHVRKTDLAQAELIYRQIVQLQPASATALLRWARLAFESGRHARALELVQQALNAEPKNYAGLLMKSQLLLPTWPNQALIAAREALEVDPDNEAAVIMLTQAWLRIGDLHKAIDILRSYLSRERPSPMVNARLALAYVHFIGGQLDESEALIEETHRLNPNAPGAAQARFLWHGAQEQWDRLVEAADKWRQGHPDDIDSIRFAARLLLGSSREQYRPKAIEFLKDALSHHPDDPESYAELGSAYYLSGQLEAARSAFERGLTSDPHDIRLLNDLAWLLCEELGSPQAAAQWAGQAIENGADSPMLLDTWGVIQYRLGNLEKSRLVLEQCLANPRTRPATRLAARFHLARTLYSMNRAESHRLLTEILENPASERLLPPAYFLEAKRLLHNGTGDSIGG